MLSCESTPSKIQHYTHSSTSKWVGDGWKENGKRKRAFFRTKAKAETWAHHKTIEATNYGTRALAVPEELRLEAVKCSEELKPFNKSLTDAVKYYVDHLRSCAQSLRRDEPYRRISGVPNQQGPQPEIRLRPSQPAKEI